MYTRIKKQVGPLKLRSRLKRSTSIGLSILVILAFPLLAIKPLPVAAYDPSTGDYPWWNAGHVSQPPAGDNITWGYTNKTTCDDRSSAYNCGTYKEGDYFVYDQWNYYLRNCTSYVAWRVAVEFGANAIGMGHATLWDTAASSKGWTVDTTPEPGDIAQWDNAASGLGHVGFVERVNANGSVYIAEYNSGLTGNFGHRDNMRADHYIDINGSGKGINGEDLTDSSGGSSGPDKTQVILNHADEVWARNTVGNSGWAMEAGPGSAADVASGGSVQLILDHAGQVWSRKGIGTGWAMEAGPNSAVEIEVGSDGTMMLRDNASQVWAKKYGSTTGWIQETGPGAAQDIETNGGVQVLRNYADQIWIRSGDIATGYWWAASDESSVREVEVASDGTIMVRNYADEVWTRKDGGWVQEAGAGSAAEIAANGGLRVIRNHADELWRKSGAPGWGGWELEAGAGSAKQIEIADDGTRILLDYADTIYARGMGPGDNWVAETGAGAAKAIAD